MAFYIKVTKEVADRLHLPLGGRTTPKAPKARIVRERPGKEERHEFGQRDRTGHIFAKGRRIHACHPV